MEKLCFVAIQKAVCLEENCHEGDSYHIQRDKVRVTLPVRVNWGGGWTDTPPYCNEKGGVVLNAAILLKGERHVNWKNCILSLQALTFRHMEQLYPQRKYRTAITPMIPLHYIRQH